MILFYQPDIHQHALEAEESRHCVKVLRKQAGDVIHIVDGRGTFYESKITEANPKQCHFEILQQWQEPPKSYHVHVAIAPTKNLDRTEWFVEKAVEIGVDAISFIQCAHSERRVLKLERIEKKAIAAMKQAQRATLPLLHPLVLLPAFLQQADPETQRFMAYVDPSNPLHLFQAAEPHRRYVVLVGPEGGFSPEEVALAQQQQFGVVGLGDYRLRTETAGLVACHILQLVNGTSSSSSS